jgi:HEAT repeat protein
MNLSTVLEWIFGGLTLSHKICLADGVFVFRWDKKADINEPTQKAIILHDGGREDLVLQVRYEGPAEEFGWLVPVPGLPEVRQGSMESFYELSRLTQEQMGPAVMSVNDAGAVEEPAGVKVIEIKTVGAYQVAILAAGNAAKLAQWLEANEFVFPKDKQDVLDSYIQKQWYFVAARIDPTESGFALGQHSRKKAAFNGVMSALTRQQLASGELHPLIISFDSEKCVFPLAISAVNGKPSEVSLYVLSSEPLMSRMIYDKQAPEHRRRAEEQFNSIRNLLQQRDQKFRRLPPPRRGGDNDPSDPPPAETNDPAERNAGWLDDLDYEGERVVRMLEIGADDLPASAKDLPRLAGKSWWLTKQVEVFAPEEMRDLEFEPAIPILAGKLGTRECQDAVRCLAQLGAPAVPLVLAAAKSSDLAERRAVASALAKMSDPRLTAAIADLLKDSDGRIRFKACKAAGRNWDPALAPRLMELLRDSNAGVRSAASFVLRQHQPTLPNALLKEMLEEDGVAATAAIKFVNVRSLPRAETIRLFSSRHLSVVATAFSSLRYSLTIDEVAPLLANVIPKARLMGLGELARIGDPPAIERIVAMLRDPDDYVRWAARAQLRRLSGQSLGADAVAYEKWWANNREKVSC